MIYKAFIAQKVIALLLHEFFLGELLQNIALVKRGNLRFYGFTLLRRFQLFGFSEQLKCTILHVLYCSRFRW